MSGEYALKLRALERFGSSTPRDIQIKVAGQDNRGVRFVTSRIVYALIKLRFLAQGAKCGTHDTNHGLITSQEL